MDTVTYPDEQVEQELESWTFERLDATEHRRAASELGVRAVPVAVALEGGRVLGRLENFVEPDVFAEWLREMRTGGDP